jgi:hypothetical protein
MIMKSEIALPQETYTAKLRGFVKIWKVHKVTGEKILVLDKDNTILNLGAGLLARLLSGASGSGISSFYIGFNNNDSFTYPTIDVAYSQPFNQLSVAAGFGYLRLPLSFPPSFLSDSGYINNTVIFSTIIASATSFYGNDFTSGTSNLYELALVATPTSNPNDDIPYARINFNQIEYDSSYALAISWGIKFLTVS